MPAEGSQTDLTFDGMREPVTTTVQKVVTEGRNTLVVFKVPEGVQQMISLRLVSGRMGADVAGLRVPVKYLKRDGDKSTVSVRLSNGKTQQIAVKVLGMDDRYAIVGEQSEQGILVQGARLVRP